MMQFFAFERFMWLWSVPVLFLLFMMQTRIKSKNLHIFGNPESVSTLSLSVSHKKRLWKIVLTIFGVSLLVTALAQPQWGEEKKQIKRKGVDLIFVVDASLSMLAQDAKPNRLEKAKFIMKSFLKHMQGDRVGIVTFAGAGFLQSPLTLDYSAFSLFADSMSVGYIPDPGSNLASGIDLALKSFPQDKHKQKAVIILSDGENMESGIEDAILEAKKQGVRLYAIGTGSVAGEPIPLSSEDKRVMGYKKDEKGEVVITKLNEELLKRISTETQALYFTASPSEQEVDIIYQHIQSLGKKDIKEQVVVEREEHFQLFLFFALICLITECILSDRIKKKRNANYSTLIRALIVFVVFVPALMLHCGFLNSPKDLTDKGNQFYKEKKYQSALESYRKAQILKPNRPEILYNVGTALHQNDQFQESKQRFEDVLTLSKDRKTDQPLLARNWYNLGNSQYRLGDFESAIQSYKKALDLDPKDKDAKHNLELLLKKKNDFQKQQDQRNQDQKNNPQQNQNKRQNQSNQDKNNQNQQSSDQNKDQNQGGGSGEGQSEEGDQKKPETDAENKPSDQQPKPDENKGEQKPKDGDTDKQNQNSSESQQKQQDYETDTQENKLQSSGGETKSDDQAKQYFQGQMSKDDALRILDALKESEKELQIYRRPQKSKQTEEGYSGRDW